MPMPWRLQADQSTVKLVKRSFNFLVSTGAVTSSIGVFSFWFGTREQKFHELDPIYDPLVRSSFVREFNPHSNRHLSDIYEARIPLDKIRPELVADFKRGGTKLVESYCSGLLGGWGFAVQRQLSARHTKGSDLTGPENIYTKADILSSKFEKGTEISGHFVVLEKNPTSILLRGGSPSDENPLREVDSLMQGIVDIDLRKGVAILKTKFMFYNGRDKGSSPPLPEVMTPLHLIYARALAANGTANCKR